MPGLTISKRLYDTALEQMLAYLLKGRAHLTADRMRADAKGMLDRTLNMAFEHIQTSSPMQSLPTGMETNQEISESTRKILRETREMINGKMVENHRAGLVQLVKGNQLSQVVAECLVDEMLAFKRKAAA